MKTYGKNKLTIKQMYSDRKMAEDAGHSHFFPGTPCKHGHIAPRAVLIPACVECKKMYYEKHMKPRRELAEKKKAEKERLRILKEKEKSIKRYGRDKLLLEEMKTTKQQALEAGHSHYFTKKPCKKGHLMPRTTGNATCVMCTRAYSKNWSHAHLKKQTVHFTDLAPLKP